MQETIKEADYLKINSFINQKLGLNFPMARQGDLIKALVSAADEFGFNNTDIFFNHLLQSTLSKSDLQILSRHLTIGETYFFREKSTFDILRNILLPEIIKKRSGDSNKIKIWSAGCSSGEEAFSIAIILNEILSRKNEWDIKILATDINADQIEKAGVGIYSEWSFRDVQDSIKEKYFKKVGKQKYQIKSSIKDMVEFSYLNLVEDSYPSVVNSTQCVDLIFCRNVLMYFEKSKREDVIAKFYNSLVEGGWLILGLTEIGYMSDKRFKPISLKDAILFQKISSETDLHKKITSSCSKKIIKPERGKDEIKSKPGYTVNQTKKESELNSNLAFKQSIGLSEECDYAIVSNHLLKILSLPQPGEKLSDEEKEKVYYYLSISFANLGQLTTALEWCELGISKYKLNPSLYFLKSNLMQGLNEFDNAIDALKNAVYLDPNYIIAHFSLANIYKRLGKQEDADKQFNILLKVLSHHDNDDIVIDSGGMTVSRIKKIVNSFITQSK